MSIEVNEAPKYWLISNEDVRALADLIEGEALHILESGLHVTDVLPADELKADHNLAVNGRYPDQGHP